MKNYVYSVEKKSVAKKVVVTRFTSLHCSMLKNRKKKKKEKKQRSQTKLNKIVIRISPSHTRSPLKKLRATVFPFLSGRRTRRAYSKLRAPDNVNVGERRRGVVGGKGGTHLKSIRQRVVTGTHRCKAGPRRLIFPHAIRERGTRQQLQTRWLPYRCGWLLDEKREDSSVGSWRPNRGNSFERSVWRELKWARAIPSPLGYARRLRSVLPNDSDMCDDVISSPQRRLASRRDLDLRIKFRVKKEKGRKKKVKK